VALGPLHLTDKSVWERLHELRETRQLAVCVVSLAELLYSTP
jgi:hypothetical protein